MSLSPRVYGKPSLKVDSGALLTMDGIFERMKLQEQRKYDDIAENFKIVNFNLREIKEALRYGEVPEGRLPIANFADMKNAFEKTLDLSGSLGLLSLPSCRQLKKSILGLSLFEENRHFDSIKGDGQEVIHALKKKGSDILETFDEAFDSGHFNDPKSFEALKKEEFSVRRKLKSTFGEDYEQALELAKIVYGQLAPKLGGSSQSMSH